MDMCKMQERHHFWGWFLSLLIGLPNKTGIAFSGKTQFSIEETEGFSREVRSFFTAIDEQNLFLCAPTRLLMASISFLTLRMLAQLSWMILSCLARLLTSTSKSFNFIRQFLLQMGSYLPMASLCFFSSSQCSKWISSAMKFSCLENCQNLRSMAFCRSLIFSLNFSIFSLRILMVSSCFLCCLNTRVNFCSSIITLSRMELLFTRSLPCSSAFLLRSLFSFFVFFMRERRESDSLFSSSNRLGLEARNLILSSSLLNQLLQF